MEYGVSGGALGAAYKAVWYVDEQGKGSPMIKVAGSKSTWPGKKESYRHPAWEEDVIQLEHESPPAHYHRLLRPVMHQGEVLPGSTPPLSEICERAQEHMRWLPAPYQALVAHHSYPVRFSEKLQTLQKQAASLKRAMLPSP